jgi:hypothetical protein
MAAMRRVPAKHGWLWIVRGWQLFARKPLSSIVFTLIVWSATQMGAVHPLLTVAAVILLPGLLGGWALACAAVERGDSVPVNLLFEGLRRRFGELAALGAFNVVANVLILLIVVGVGGELMRELISDPSSMDEARVAEAQGRVLQALFLGMLIAVPVSMAVWFAPLGVLLGGLRPTQALLASLAGMVRNWPAFTVYGVVWTLLGFVVFRLCLLAVKPMPALGLTIWMFMPVFVPSVYASYRDIFDPTQPAAAADAQA